MSSESWDPHGEAQNALRTIAADPRYGPEALSSPQMMTNLLKDMLPDAPREASVLVAAADAGVPTALQRHVAQGMDAETASQLAAGTLADRTALTADACAWATGSLAAVLITPAVPAQAKTVHSGGSDQLTTADAGTGAVTGPAVVTAGPPSASSPRASRGPGRWPRSWRARSRTSMSTTPTAATRFRSPCSVAPATTVARGTGPGRSWWRPCRPRPAWCSRCRARRGCGPRRRA